MHRISIKTEMIFIIFFIAAIFPINARAITEQQESTVAVRKVQVKSVNELSATIEITYQYNGTKTDRRIGIEFVTPSPLVEKYRLDERRASTPFPRFSFPVSQGIHKFSMPVSRESFVPSAYITHEIRLAEVIHDLRSKKQPIVLSSELYPLEVHWPALSSYKNGALEKKIQKPGPSPWFENEKLRYAKALSRSKYDVLVLPVAATPNSLDSVARNMMMRQLSYAIRTRTNYRIPDSTWVIRALGENQRIFDEDEIGELASNTGVQWIVIPKVSRPKNGLYFDLSITVKHLEPGFFKDSWKKQNENSWRNIEFSDTNPPEEVFRSHLETYLESLGFSFDEPGVNTRYSRTLTYSDTTLESLTRIPGKTPIDRATALQLVASLYPQHAIESQQLWERSLIALEEASPESDDYRLLKARAETHLYRRPYALKVLGIPGDDREKELYWYLQGNLPKTQQHVDALNEPVDRFIGLTEIETLRRAYGREEGYTYRLKEAIEAAPKWKELVSSRLSSVEWFDTEIQNYSIREIVKKHPLELETRIKIEQIKYSVLQRLGIRFVPRHTELLELIQPMEQTVWNAEGQQWSTTTGDQGLREWDYFDLLFADSRHAAIKGFRSVFALQKLPDRARKISASLRYVIDGYPPYLIEQATFDYRTRDETLDKDQKTKKKLKKKIIAEAIQANHWSGGESLVNARAEKLLSYTNSAINYEHYDDEPLRYYRFKHRDIPQRPDYRRITMEDWARSAMYSIYDTSSFSSVRSHLRFKDKAGLVTYEENNKHRFIGSGYRSSEIIVKYRNRFDQEALMALQAAQRDDPDDFRITKSIVEKYLQKGDYKSVRKIVESSVLYRYEDEEPVYRTNEIASIASSLDGAGQIEEALPLYKKAISFRTGSDWALFASERVALYNHDYTLAAESALASVKRYDSESERQNYSRYMFLLGQPDKAMNMMEYLGTRGDPDKGEYIPPFTARLGFRINRFSREQVKQWLMKMEKSALSARQRFRLERIYFLTFVADEIPTQQDIQIMDFLNSNIGRNKSLFRKYEGYAYYRRGECNKAKAPLQEAWTWESRQTGWFNDVWYYQVSCAVQSGNLAEANRIFSRARGTNPDKSLHYQIAYAVFNGYQGKHRQAVGALKKAQDLIYSPKDFGVNTAMRVIEAAELLYQKTGQPEYKRVILDIARRAGKSGENSWSNLVEAQYRPERQHDVAFLAKAIYLNPSSHRISKLDPTAVKRANRWLQQNQPFH